MAGNKPRRQPHMTRKEHTRQLAWCFAASFVFMIILALVSWAWGQDHPFPFKTLEDITTGTPAWVLEDLPQSHACGPEISLSRFQYKSGAGSIWVVFTDRKQFGAAYFPPGVAYPPVAVVVGIIKDGNQAVVESNLPFTGQTPCAHWALKSAAGGSDG